MQTTTFAHGGAVVLILALLGAYYFLVYRKQNP